MMKEFENIAFISYRHSENDKRYAKWLQRKLEHYHIPTRLQKEYSLSKRVKPVFLDESDLSSSGSLEQTLNTEITRSKFLLVICSKAMACKSDWIEKEIQYFWKSGHPERTIPIILDGEPNSKQTEEECFPPSLLAMPDQLVGINVSEFGKSKSLIKIVASILEVRFDVLWKRERRRKIRNGILSFILCTLFLGVAIWGVYTNNQKLETQQRQEFQKTMQSVSELSTKGWGQYALDLADESYSRLSQINKNNFIDSLKTLKMKVQYQSQLDSLRGIIQLDGIRHGDIDDILFSGDLKSLYVCYNRGFLKYSLYSGQLMEKYAVNFDIYKHWIDEANGKVIAYAIDTNQPVVFDEKSGMCDTQWMPSRDIGKIGTTNRRRFDEIRRMSVKNADFGVTLTEDITGLQISVPLNSSEYLIYPYTNAYLSPNGTYVLLPAIAQYPTGEDYGCITFPANDPTRQKFFSCDPECCMGFSADETATVFVQTNNLLPFSVMNLDKQTEWTVTTGGQYELYSSDDFSVQCTSDGGYLYIYQKPGSSNESNQSEQRKPYAIIAANMTKTDVKYSQTHSSKPLGDSVKRLSNESSSNASDIIEHYQTGHYFKNGIYYYDEGGENERYLFTLDDNYSNYSLRVYDKIDQVDMNIDQNITGINFLGSIAISMNSDLALVTASLMDSQKDNVIILYSIDKDKHTLCYQRSFDVAMTMCGIAFGEDNQSFLVLQDDIVDVYSLQDGQQMNHYRLESSKLKNARDTVEETAAVQYYKQDNYFDVMNDVILIHKEYLTSSDLEQYCQIYRLSTGEYITDINCGTINAGLCYESEYSVYNYDLGLLVVGYKDLILAQINVP